MVARTQRYKINSNMPFWGVVDDYCFKSKNLYNYANYIIRQEFINNNRWIRYNELFQLVRDSEAYKDLGSNIGQATLCILDKNWKSFMKAIKDWKKRPDKYLGRPKIPKYKAKDGRFILSLDNNKVALRDGYIFFIRKTFKPFNHIFKTNAEGRLLQCRFIPRCGDYIMEIVYEIEVPEPNGEIKQVASIDLGVENFVTMVNNIGIPPIIVKGGVLKSINQYYNKRKATIQSELKRVNGNDWSKSLQRLTNKRFEKIKYHMHCISKQIVDWCVNNNIDTLIVGHNTTWKQGALYMQNFTYIPYDMFIGMLKYKCENVGIVCIEVDEAYTSGTSFLDGELPIKENYNKDRRIRRGLFKADCGRKINADVNGAYQIMKKVIPNIFVDGIEGVRFTTIVAQGT